MAKYPLIFAFDAMCRPCQLVDHTHEFRSTLSIRLEQCQGSHYSHVCVHVCPNAHVSIVMSQHMPVLSLLVSVHMSVHMSVHKLELTLLC